MTEQAGQAGKTRPAIPTPWWAKTGVTIVRVKGEKQPREFTDFQEYMRFVDDLEAQGRFNDIVVSRRLA